MLYFRCNNDETVRGRHGRMSKPVQTAGVARPIQFLAPKNVLKPLSNMGHGNFSCIFKLLVPDPLQYLDIFNGAYNLSECVFLMLAIYLGPHISTF